MTMTLSEHVAVLVVDAQAGLLIGASSVLDAAALVDRLGFIIEQARKRGLSIIYTQDKDVGPLDSPEWLIHPALAPPSGELVVRKAFADSFYQTSLHAALAAQTIRQLVVVGCKTDACVEMTCRRAVSLGYDVVLVSDGHSTTDNRFMTAAESIEYYNLVLDGFGTEDGFGNGLHSVQLRSSGELFG